MSMSNKLIIFLYMLGPRKKPCCLIVFSKLGPSCMVKMNDFCRLNVESPRSL